MSTAPNTVLPDELLAQLPDALRARIQQHAAAIALSGTLAAAHERDRQPRYRLRFRTERSGNGERRQMTISLGRNMEVLEPIKRILGHLRREGAAARALRREERQRPAKDNALWKLGRKFALSLADGKPWLRRQLSRDYKKRTASRDPTALLGIIWGWPNNVHLRRPGRPGRPRKKRMW